jgi:hypothetical protein
MKKKNHKDIQRFNQIAEILGIKFDEAEELSKIVKTMMQEIEDEKEKQDEEVHIENILV